MSFAKSGRRWPAQQFVAWTSALVRTLPRPSVVTVIQPDASRSETLITGVLAWRSSFLASSRMLSKAWTNLYGQLTLC